MLIFTPDHIFSFNGEISVSYPFETGLEGGLSANEVHTYLKKLKVEEIDVAPDGTTAVFSSGKKSKAGFVLTPGAKPYDLGLGAEDTKKFLLPEDFVDGLRFAMFSIAQDASKGSMTCAYVAGDLVLSCDNYRATRYTMKKPLAKETKPIMVPLTAVRPLLDHAPVKFSVEKTAGWVNFENKEGTVLSCRAPFESYQAELVLRLFTEEGQKLEIPPEIVEAMNRTEILADEGGAGFREVEVQVKKGSATIRSEGARGWAEEHLETSYKGKDELQFFISPELFYNIASHVKEMEVSPTKIIFRGPNFQHIIALLSRPKE
jgi:hypothetical protein